MMTDREIKEYIKWWTKYYYTDYESSPNKKGRCSMSLCSNKDKDQEPKIVYRLEKVGDRALVFQVLHMDERFRRGSAGSSTTHRPAGVGLAVVYSSGTPVLGGSGGSGSRYTTVNAIYLHGNNKASEDIVSVMNFTTEKNRDIAMTKVEKSLDDWCDNCDKWSPVKKKVWNGDLPDGCVALSSEG